MRLDALLNAEEHVVRARALMDEITCADRASAKTEMPTGAANYRSVRVSKPCGGAERVRMSYGSLARQSLPNRARRHRRGPEQTAAQAAVSRTDPRPRAHR